MVVVAAPKPKLPPCGEQRVEAVVRCVRVERVEDGLLLVRGPERERGSYIFKIDGVHVTPLIATFLCVIRLSSAPP